MALAHGCTGKGNDQVRFELTYKAFAPHLKVLAPWREWTIRTREEALDYAREHQIPVEASLEKIYSRDRNLWHLSHEGSVLEDPATPVPEDVWQLTRSPQQAPEAAGEVQIGFEKGVPVVVNGSRLPPVEIVETLNRIGGEHGIGRIDLVENRFVGMKSRGAYETPGGTLIVLAHRELEALCLDRETTHYKQHVAARLCGACLQRILVHAAAGGAGRILRPDASGRHRRGATETLPRKRGGGGPQLSLLALRGGDRQLHHGRFLQPEGRRRLHQLGGPSFPGSCFGSIALFCGGAGGFGGSRKRQENFNSQANSQGALNCRQQLIRRVPAKTLLPFFRK